MVGGWVAGLLHAGINYFVSRGNCEVFPLMGGGRGPVSFATTTTPSPWPGGEGGDSLLSPPLSLPRLFLSYCDEVLLTHKLRHVSSSSFFGRLLRERVRMTPGHM